MLTVGRAASKLSLLSVLVEAVLLLPAASCAAPAAMLAVTVPLVVVPLTATVYVLGPPLTVALLLPPAVPPIVTSAALKPLTASLNTAVKLIGPAAVGSACAAAWLMLTVGAVLSLATVTVTGAEVVRLPAASRATAVSVCEPLVTVVVFHGAEYGAAVSSVPALPSTKNWTPTTAVSSAAVAVTVTVPDTVAPEAGELMLTVGAAASKRTLLSVLVDAVLLLPAASCAAPAPIVAVTVPLVVMPLTATVYVLGPPLTVAVLVPPAVPPIVTSAALKPLTASLNTAVKVIGLAPVGSACAAAWLMLTVGGVVSLATVTVTGAEVVRLPAAS